MHFNLLMWNLNWTKLLEVVSVLCQSLNLVGKTRYHQRKITGKVPCPEGFRNTLLHLEVCWCRISTSMNPIHTTQDANLAFQGYSGGITWAQAHGSPQSSQANTAPFLCSTLCSILSVITGKRWGISHLKVYKCGRCQLYHSLAVGPLAGHFPYVGCGFSTCVTKRLESMSLKVSIAKIPYMTLPGPSGLCQHPRWALYSHRPNPYWALGHAYVYINDLTVSYVRSRHRPFTNVAFPLTHRIPGCDSGYAPEREALGILLLMTDAHSIPFPDLCPHGAFYTCYLSYPGSFYLRGLSISGEAPISPLAAATKTVRGK